MLTCAAPALLAQPAISNFMAAPGDAKVALSWNGSTSATGYNVKQATSAIGPLTVIATNVPTTDLVVTNLKNGVSYFFAVSSVSDGFESADTARLKNVPSAPVTDLLPAGAKLEKLASGLLATEGPVWNPTGGYLAFSDTLGNRTLRWTSGSGITLLRQSTRPNGNAFDLLGRLITCEQAAGLVDRTEMDGTVTPLVTEYKGKKFNEPNDVVVKSDGTIWFTDPAYSSQTQLGRYVYRFDPADGNATVTATATNLNQPNGLCFSLDETKLFVADTGLSQIRVFDVLPDNSLTNSRVFVSEGADGIRLTLDGRLFTCNWDTGNNVKSFGPDGRFLGSLVVPEPPTNLSFGGTNQEMLFITAGTSLYGITRMPDLIVTTITRFPANPLSGQAVAFSAVIKNQGTAPTLGSQPIRVTFSVDGETNLVWSEFNASIPPDASIVVTANGGERTRTWTATAGTHSIKAMVDSLNAHRESNETNNVLAQNLTVSAPAPDSDGDGLDDLSEATAGTDPTDAASTLKILAAERLADDRLALTWSSVPGKNYRVSRQANLGNLESAEFSGPITATTETTSWTNNVPFTRPVQFLRIQVVP